MRVHNFSKSFRRCFRAEVVPLCEIERARQLRKQALKRLAFAGVLIASFEYCRERFDDKQAKGKREFVDDDPLLQSGNPQHTYDKYGVAEVVVCNVRN